MGPVREDGCGRSRKGAPKEGSKVERGKKKEKQEKEGKCHRCLSRVFIKMSITVELKVEKS